MKKCLNCSAENNDSAVYCVSCGATLAQPQDAQPATSVEPPHMSPEASQQQVPPQQPNAAGQPYQQPPSQAYGQMPQQPYGQTANVTGYIVWSVINMLCCCTPLGVVALIFSINAKNAFTKEAFDSKINIVRILNIIATILGVIIVLIVFFIYGMAIVSALQYESYY